jgi:hypothetical protein
VDLVIDSIRVTVTGGYEDAGAMATEIERRLGLALEALSGELHLLTISGDDSLDIDLPVIDWQEETDITGKMVQLLKEALCREGEGR